MSEPQTTAKVRVETTKGPIDIELWAKEVPVVSRAFLQKCQDNEYVGRCFSAITKDYVQLGSEAAYTMKDEYHSRIRFNKKGLLAAVRENIDIKNNHSIDSFLLTTQQLSSYDNKYVVFGKIVNDTFYNVLKIQDSEVDADGKVLYPAEVTKTSVVTKYFDDLQQTKVESVPVSKVSKPKKKVRLNYDMEAGEEEDSGSYQMKSAHELLDDKKLRKRKVEEPETAVTTEVGEGEREEEGKDEDNKEVIEVKNDENKKVVEHDTQQSGVEQDEVKQDDVKQDKVDEPINVETKQANQKEKETIYPEAAYEPPVRKTKLQVDPTIDSEYDSNLDLSSDDETFDASALRKHTFKTLFSF